MRRSKKASIEGRGTAHARFAFVALAICCLHSLLGPVPIIAFSKALDQLTLASHSTNSISTSESYRNQKYSPGASSGEHPEHPILPSVANASRTRQSVLPSVGKIQPHPRGRQDVGVPGQEKHPENHGKLLVLLSFFLVNTLGLGHMNMTTIAITWPPDGLARQPPLLSPSIRASTAASHSPPTPTVGRPSDSNDTLYNELGVAKWPPGHCA